MVVVGGATCALEVGDTTCALEVGDVMAPSRICHGDYNGGMLNIEYSMRIGETYS